MSKKRTSAESSNDEQTTEDSDEDSDRTSSLSVAMRNIGDSPEMDKEKQGNQDPSFAGTSFLSVAMRNIGESPEMDKEKQGNQDPSFAGTSSLSVAMQKKRASPEMGKEKQGNQDPSFAGTSSLSAAMRKKGASPEMGKENQDTFLNRREDTYKRAKLAASTDETVIQDLPIEMLEYILVKSIAMEVKGMKLAKSVWKEKADLVISRLRTVCSYWSDTLTSNFFRNELHRALYQPGYKDCGLEVIQQAFIKGGVVSTAALPTTVFLLCQPIGSNSPIFAFKIANLRYASGVIVVPGGGAQMLACCEVHRALYVLSKESEDNSYSILKITQNDKQLYDITPLISRVWMPSPTFAITLNGDIAILKHVRHHDVTMTMYDTFGHKIDEKVRLPSHVRRATQLISLPTGNMILVSMTDQCQTRLTEVDSTGNVVREYDSKLGHQTRVCVADCFGRLLLTDSDFGLEILDKELNCMSFYDRISDGDICAYPNTVCYVHSTNQMIGTGYDHDDNSDFVAILRLA